MPHLGLFYAEINIVEIRGSSKMSRKDLLKILHVVNSSAQENIRTHIRSSLTDMLVMHVPGHQLTVHEGGSASRSAFN